MEGGVRGSSCRELEEFELGVGLPGLSGLAV